MTATAARFVVSGRVQGVAYRAHARAAARGLGIVGHARNLADGRVDVLAVGDDAALATFERALWRGSPASAVGDVRREAVPVPAGLDDFGIG